MIKALLLGFLLSVVALPALAAKHALVVGNAAYDSLGDLQNTHNDAKAYATAFGALGYEVTFATDLTLDQTEDALERFLTRINPGDDVAFVYSGHGWSDGGTNYLVPVDAPKQGRNRKLKRLSIALRNGVDGVLDEFEAAGAGLVIAIVDACRNNPFAPVAGTKSVGMSRGLAPVKAATGTFVIYSAGEGQEALDRLPGDSPDVGLSVFTRAFIPYLRKGVLLEDAISYAQVQTADMALQVDGHLQHPAYYDQTLGGTCLGGVCQASMPALSPCDALYSEAKSEDACFAYEAYLGACQDHVFNPLAKSYLSRMCSQASSPPKPVIPPMANDLTLVSWGGAYQKSQTKAYSEPYGQMRDEVTISWESSSHEALSKLRQMNGSGDLGWDLVDVVAADAITLCDAGLAMPVDHNAVLAPAPDGTSAVVDFGETLVSKCFVPQIAFSMAVGYNTELVGGRPPKSICALFDTQTYPGKRALSQWMIGNMEWALLCDGVAKRDIYDVLATKSGQDRAFAKLDTIKDQTIWWRSGAETLQLLADRKIVMGSTYNGRLFSAIAEQNLPIGMLWDAQILDFDGWIIPSGLPEDRLARIRDFLRFATDSQRLADQAKYIAYGPARASSIPLVGKHEVLGIAMGPQTPTHPDNLANAFVTQYEFWARHRNDIEARFRAWQAK